MPPQSTSPAAAPGSAPVRGPRVTKERLLDAAEVLFAERGFEGTSMRALTQAAGTSVSAAHYHFGSKEDLLRAVLLRRVEPMNRRRLERLDALEREAAGAPLPLRTIFDAYLRPPFEQRAKQGGRNDLRFVASRLFSDPPELVSSLKRELFGDVSRRFLDALCTALPDHSRAELGLRLQFAVGAMVHSLSGNLDDAPHLADAGGGAGDSLLDDASVIEQMIAFFSAGFPARAGGTR